MRFPRTFGQVLVVSLLVMFSIGPSHAEDRNNQPPQWKNVILPDAEQDTFYSFNLTVTDPDHNLSELNLTDDCPLFNITDDAKINFTPRNADVGQHTFNVTATDPGGLNDTLKLDLFVANVNDPPTLHPIPTQYAAVNHIFVLDVSKYVDDPDLELPPAYRDRMTYRDNTPRLDTNLETGVVTWDMPTADDLGDFYFKVTVQDTKGRYAEQEIHIRVVYAGAPWWDRVELPDAIQDTPYSFVLTVTDSDNTLSELTLSDDSPLFDISATGEIAFTPGNQDVGTHRFNVTAEDPIGLRDTMELELTVRNVNDPPSLRPLPDQTVDEDKVLSLDLTAYADDPDLHFSSGALDSLTYSVNSSLVAVGPLSGLLTWHHPEDMNVGIHVFNVSVTDEGGLQASQDLVVEVMNVNDPPVLEAMEWQHLIEDVPYSMVVVLSDEDLLVPGSTEAHTFVNHPGRGPAPQVRLSSGSGSTAMKPTL